MSAYILKVNPMNLKPFLEVYRSKDDLGTLHHQGQLIVTKTDLQAVKNASVGNQPVEELLTNVDPELLEE